MKIIQENKTDYLRSNFSFGNYYDEDENEPDRIMVLDSLFKYIKDDGLLKSIDILNDNHGALWWKDRWWSGCFHYITTLTYYDDKIEGYTKDYKNYYKNVTDCEYLKFKDRLIYYSTLTKNPNGRKNVSSIALTNIYCDVVSNMMTGDTFRRWQFRFYVNIDDPEFELMYKNNEKL